MVHCNRQEGFRRSLKVKSQSSDLQESIPYLKNSYQTALSVTLTENGIIQINLHKRQKWLKVGENYFQKV